MANYEQQPDFVLETLKHIEKEAKIGSLLAQGTTLEYEGTRYYGDCLPPWVDNLEMILHHVRVVVAEIESLLAQVDAEQKRV